MAKKKASTRTCARKGGMRVTKKRAPRDAAAKKRLHGSGRGANSPKNPPSTMFCGLLGPRELAPILISADMVGDLERIRIGLKHRLDLYVDKRGWADRPEITMLQNHYDAVSADEKMQIKALEAAVMQTRLAVVVKTLHGIGPKALGRFIAQVAGCQGPEIPSLLKYCGLVPRNEIECEHGECPPCKQCRGKYSHQGKIRARIMADSAYKQNETYKKLYHDRRAVTEQRNWTPMHQHNDALRFVAIRIVRDIYEVLKGDTQEAA